ncbi:Retrovirus-related Pol polyprotein from transposon 17.6 [Gossypium australe]|uniref:Retrovirus-related Pol polyprotein from transposon 17.6 n=1 Tax=Gossypium australe TaxID=47621 RepID=A0A5B6WE89_9ROSI|nr:Retrovirus-related Pol polyprotein from transposon 17.6 [Gossypium australe]
MEMLIQRTNVDEDDETTMIHFVDGLNKYIANTLRLQTYIELDETVRKANEIEQQLKEQGPLSFTTSLYYKVNSSNCTFKNSKLHFIANKFSTSGDTKKLDWKSGVPTKMQVSSKQPSSSGSNMKRTREIECFKCKRHRHYSGDCPNTRLLLIKQNGEYISDFDNLDMKEFMENVTHGGDICQEEVIEPTNEEEDFNDFYCLVCLIKSQLCSLIVDSGSCANVLGNHEDEVWYDVVPMHAAHLILVTL